MVDEKERVKGMDALGHCIDDFLFELYGKRMGFMLIVSPFGEKGIADYVSNIQRSDAITSLREAAEHLEAGSDIPRTIGTA